MSGFGAWCLLPWVSRSKVKGLEWIRSKRETEIERIQGVERDIWVRFVSLVFSFFFFLFFFFFFTIGFLRGKER